MLLNGLLVLVWQQILETDRRNVKRRTECFFEVVLHVCEEERQHFSLQNFINEIYVRAAIDRFLRSPPHHKPFSIISDPPFTESNKVLEHL